MILVTLHGRPYTITSATVCWLERSPWVWFKERAIRFHFFRGGIENLLIYFNEER